MFINNIRKLEYDETDNMWLKMPSKCTEKDAFLQGKHILIRDSYNILYEAIRDRTNPHFDPVRQYTDRPFMILGNPGVGKSFFGIYLVWLLIQKKQSFIYKPQQGESSYKFLQFIYYDSNTDIARLVDLECEPLPLEMLKNLWYISDTAVPNEQYTINVQRTVFISSPNNITGKLLVLFVYT